MATSTPIVKSIRAIPVAGHDSMLLNLSGAHGPYFTRNILIIEDNSGNIGVGEIPGGEKILATLNDAKALVEGQPIGEYKNLLKKFSKLLLIVTVVVEETKPLICVQPFTL
ncbi:D-glucarate dehydratase [Acinetobacter baumannii]|nr:D-glucarate dehydratase [Acinetobacter baumannii]